MTLMARAMGAIALFGLTAACSSADSDSLTSDQTVVPQGYVVIDAASSAGVVGRYIEGLRSISFETRLGPEKPVEQRVADDSATHEADARLLSNDGFPFSMKVGGHAFIEDEWAEYSNDSGDPTERAEDFRMGRRMAMALSMIEWPGSASELTALRDLGAANDDASLASEPAQDRPALTPLGVSVTGYYHQIGVGKKYVIGLFGGITGYHSATWGKDYKVNPPIPQTGLMQQVITCNHGTCADVMGVPCYEKFDNRPATLPTYATSKCGTFVGINSHGVETGCCNTWYDFGGNYHVCNDDSAVQLSLIRGYTTADLVNTCADGKLRKDPPMSCLTYSGP